MRTDNPFADGGGKPEIYSYGLRNPWRFSFDSETGHIWIGDVGQGAFEEVSVATEPGQNFGWVDTEGCVCTPGQGGCTPSDYTLPIHSYAHDVGQSITGGYVYHGTELGPNLQHRYIFGDFVAGTLFAIDTKSTNEACGTRAVELLKTDFGISTFGAIHGKIMLADYSSGKLYQLSPDSKSSPSGVPRPASPSSAPSDNEPSSNAYQNQVTADNSGRKVTISWSLEGDSIQMQVEGKASGWIAVGFSEDGSMDSGGKGSDIVMGFISENSPTVSDYWATAHRQPALDDEQNIEDVAIQSTNGRLQMRFSRPLTTTDSSQDRPIDSDKPGFFIWALSDAIPTGPDSFSYHSARGGIAFSSLRANAPAGTGSKTPSSSPEPENLSSLILPDSSLNQGQDNNNSAHPLSTALLALLFALW